MLPFEPKRRFCSSRSRAPLNTGNCHGSSIWRNDRRESMREFDSQSGTDGAARILRFVDQDAPPTSLEEEIVMSKAAMRFLILGTLLTCGICTSSAQSCTNKTGKGTFTGEMCCGSNGCSYCTGFLISSGEQTQYRSEGSPCNCLYTEGQCPDAMSAHLSVTEDPAERYQSRPKLFLGCKGSIVWAMPPRMTSNDHAS